MWQARLPAIVVNEGVLLSRIYQLECEPSSDDISEWEAGQDFEACGDVDAIAENVAVLDDNVTDGDGAW